MTFRDEVRDIALQSFAPREAGAFYGSAERLSPGAGVIYQNITYPRFNSETGRFFAGRGHVLVLTHECDIDPANERDFNEYFVAAPLILLEDFADAYENDNRKEIAKSLASAVAKDKVQRLFYLPPADPLAGVPALAYGALIYWNQLTSAHISQFRTEGVSAMCALSEYAMRHADRHFESHFLRPKSEQLPRLGLA